jgi:hypothetical protein
MSTSGPSYRPTSGTSGPKDDETFKPVNKHLLTPLERQRLQVRINESSHTSSRHWVLILETIQIERLLKDPTKEVHLPKGPREKQLRPPKEMIKNVSGSSAGVSERSASSSGSHQFTDHALFLYSQR